MRNVDWWFFQSWTKDHNGPVSTHLVAKEFVNTPVPNVIVFRNPRFFLRRPFSSLPTEEYSRFINHDVMFNLKHPSFNVCVRTRTVVHTHSWFSFVALCTKNAYFYLRLANEL